MFLWLYFQFTDWSVPLFRRASQRWHILGCGSGLHHCFVSLPPPPPATHIHTYTHSGLEHAPALLLREPVSLLDHQQGTSLSSLHFRPFVGTCRTVDAL